MKTEKPDVLLEYKKKDGKDQWFMAKDKGSEKGPGSYEKLVVGKSDDGLFVFAIKNNDIKFDPATPIVFKTEGTGPGKPAQFIHKIVDGKLIVADPNVDQVPTDYYYQLNFVGDSGPVPPLDPIIQNGCCKVSFAGGGGGGGIQLMSGTGAVVLLAAAILGAVLYKVIAR